MVINRRVLGSRPAHPGKAAPLKLAGHLLRTERRAVEGGSGVIINALLWSL